MINQIRINNNRAEIKELKKAAGYRNFNFIILNYYLSITQQ